MLDFYSREAALDILEKAKAKGIEFLLPVDTRTTREFKEGAERFHVPAEHIERDVVDIGVLEFAHPADPVYL